MLYRFFLLGLFILFFIGCGSDGFAPPEDEVETTNINVKIGYDNELFQDERKITIISKRVKLEDIATIQLSIFDNKKTFIKNQPFIKTQSGNWELDVYNLPTNRELNFVAEAFDKNQTKILSGYIKQSVTENSSDVVIPLKLASQDLIISLPSIETISGGDIDVSKAKGIVTKRVKFSIVNPNAEIVKWNIVPDELLSKYGFFLPTEGELDFRYTNQIDLLVDFNITNQYVETAQGKKVYFKDLSFENRLELNTSSGDLITTFFKIYEQKNSLKVSIAPIVDNLAVTRKDNDIYVNAIIDSKLLKNETCSNDFENIFTPDFNLSKKTFQDLFIHFYSAVPYVDPETQEELNPNSVINGLRKDEETVRLLNYDLQNSYEKLFASYQKQYGYENEYFNIIYKYLTNENFIKLLEYYKAEEKNYLTPLKIYYASDEQVINDASDENITELLDWYQKRFGGEEKFSSLLGYMIFSDDSTLLDDYSLKDHNFSQNGDYYYQRFEADTEKDKNNLHKLVEYIKDKDFSKFFTVFNIPHQKLYILIQGYFKDFNVKSTSSNYKEFADLLNFIIDDNFEGLFERLTAKYLNSKSFNNLAKMVNSIAFQQYLNFYKTKDSISYDFLKAKYDFDVCETLDFSNINYEWVLKSNPYNDTSKAYIVDRYTNPIKITNSNGNLKDKLFLTVTNEQKIQTDYSYYLSITNWVDEDGNPIEAIRENPLLPDGNLTNSNNNEENNSSNVNNSTSENNNSVVTDPKDYEFELYTSSEKVNLLYGETKTIRFSTSKIFKNLSYDVIGIQNGELFSVSKVTKLSDKEFEIKVTAKDLAGVGKFTFMAQNDYFSDFIEIEVTTQKPIEIYNLRNEYSILYGSAIDINFSIKNPRGDNFTFKIDNSVNGYFTSAPVKTQIDNVLSDTNLIHVIAQSEGSDQMILKITDTTLEPEYSIDIPIRITVVKSDEQKTAEELQLREEAIYKCNNLVLDKSIYEYVSDVYDENGDEVFAPNGILSIRSDNSLYPSHPLYSTLLILYPVGVDNDGATLSNSFYSYNHNDMRYLGEIKYSSNLKGKEFFVKYYDSTTNSVVCEKHRF